MKQHFVEFLSPGTFVAETTTRPIDAWSVDAATRMADEITERHGATPYGFRFITRERGENDLDSHVSDKSGTYFLGGEVWTLEELERRGDPNDRILIANMRGNGFDRVVVNTNSWKWTQPLNDDDVVLDYTPPQRRAAV